MALPKLRIVQEFIQPAILAQEIIHEIIHEIIQEIQERPQAQHLALLLPVRLLPQQQP